MQDPVDDGAQAGVLVVVIIIEGLAGNAHLAADVRHGNGRIRGVQQIFKQAVLDLPLAAVGD